MEDGLRVQRFSRQPPSGRRDGTASGRKWRWGWAKEMGKAAYTRRPAREKRKVCETPYVLADGKETSWAGMEGSSEWNTFIVGGDCQAGKVCWQHTTREARTRKGPFIYFITFDPEHNSRK